MNNPGHPCSQHTFPLVHASLCPRTAFWSVQPFCWALGRDQQINRETTSLRLGSLQRSNHGFVAWDEKRKWGWEERVRKMIGRNSWIGPSSCLWWIDADAIFLLRVDVRHCKLQNSVIFRVSRFVMATRCIGICSFSDSRDVFRIYGRRSARFTGVRPISVRYCSKATSQMYSHQTPA